MQQKNSLMVFQFHYHVQQFIILQPYLKSKVQGQHVHTIKIKSNVIFNCKKNGVLEKNTVVPLLHVPISKSVRVTSNKSPKPCPISDIRYLTESIPRRSRKNDGAGPKQNAKRQRILSCSICHPSCIENGKNYYPFCIGCIQS